jgi:Domain of unknown function (DUF4375)
MERTLSDLDKAIAFTFDELEKQGRDVARLPIELQTVVRVVSATGVIGNGGLRYFFERDWEGSPLYDVFINAFRTIGANEIANSINGMVSLFGFPDPQSNGARRHARYAELWESEPSLLRDYELLPVEIYETTEKTWKLLDQYVHKHRRLFAA